MLDLYEKKRRTVGTAPAIAVSIPVVPVQESELPLNQRKVSFHRRFVESQKELKIVKEKLMRANSFKKSLQSEINKCVSQDEYMNVTNAVEQLQQQLTTSKEELRHESDRHRETQKQLLKAEDNVYNLEEEMNKIHDSRLDMIDLSRRLDSLSTDDPIATSEERSLHVATKQELLAAQNTISMLKAKVERQSSSQLEQDEKVTNLLFESKATLDEVKTQTLRQERELAILRTDRVRLQCHLEQCRSLLWEVEESRHYNRQKWNKLSKVVDCYVETEWEQRINEMTIEQCKSLSTIESLRRKNRHLQALNKSLSDETFAKNNVICEMSRSGAVLAAAETFKVEQERSLNMATELSVAYAECQMKVDKLTETVNRLKVEQIQKMDAPNDSSSFRSTIRNKNYQLQPETTPNKLDGIRSISSIFSRSFNASFTGLDTFSSDSDNHQTESRSLRLDVLAMKIPKVDLTVTCGTVSRIKITKVPSRMKNTSISMKSNHNKEKVAVASSYSDKVDILSGTVKHNGQCSQKPSLIEKGYGTTDKDQRSTNVSESTANSIITELLESPERPLIITI